MTTISATVIAHTAVEGRKGAKPLVSIQGRFPRFILAELNTHRVFSRNARSSRAVPVKTIIQELIDDPVIPIHWGKNQRGMQAFEECENTVSLTQHQYGVGNYWARREDAWLWARDRAVEVARSFDESGYHKQVINRLLEPFMHVDVLITSTEWDNFFALRIHEDAEPHIHAFALRVREAIEASQPRMLQPGDCEWHLPFVTDAERAEHGLDIGRKLSVARCARISYAPFDGNAAIEREIERYEKLVGAEPRHSSPAEHQARPDFVKHDGHWEKPHLAGNFTGWCQLRRYLDQGLQP